MYVSYKFKYITLINTSILPQSNLPILTLLTSFYYYSLMDIFMSIICHSITTRDIFSK